MPDVFGFLNIDKPLGMTSHDVVHKVRRGLQIRKVGHAGTLDPLATGVLVVCLGSATRLSEYVMASRKRYQAQVRLGIVTTTYDQEGDITQTRDAAHITRADVEAVLPRFTGEIDQIPPAYSAIKQSGRKLYEMARAGETVEPAPRRVIIESLEIVDWSLPLITLDVVCGAGTYIRSLAFDLGEALGVGANLAGLMRTASGTFALENAVTLDGLLNDPDWPRHIISPDVALAAMPVVRLDEVSTEHVIHGRSIPRQPVDEPPVAQPARAYDPAGRFIAILESGDGVWRPHKVFLSHEQ